MSGHRPEAVEVRVLGPLEVVRGDVVEPLRSTKQRLVLGLLVASRGRPVPADGLLLSLWGEAPSDGASATLQSHVSRLRTALGGASTITYDPAGYRLRGVSTDLARLEAAAAPDVGYEDLVAALALWRGTPYDDLEPVGTLDLDRAHLVALRWSLVERKADADLLAGRHDQAAAELELALREEPLRESLSGRLMLALYRSGRQADALGVYRRLRALLADELGVDPAPDVQQLHSAILAQSPSLEPWPSAVSGPSLVSTSFAARPGTSSAELRAPDGSIDGRALSTAVQLPSWLTPSSRTPLVGRAAELAALAQVVAGAGTSPRPALLLVGEPGVGKTRLAAEAARAAQEEGVLVLAGRCDPDLEVAYGPFADALQQVRRAVGEDVLPALLGRWPGELARLVPELGERGLGLPPPLVSDPETERWRLFDAVVSAMAALAAPGGLLLVIEDLHWATPATLALLSHLLRSDEAQRLVVVGTCRDTEVGDGQSPDDLLLRVPGLRRLPLAGLDEQAIARLVSSAWAEGLEEDARALSGLIAKATGGNPLFVEELLRHLAESGDLDRGPRGWSHVTDPDTLGLPQGVRDVIVLRLRALGKVTNDVLRAGAVVGQEFQLDLVVALSGLDQDTCLDALDVAVTAHLVVDLGADRWRFVHALVRAALYDTLGLSRRARWHAALAALLELARQPDPVALAYHWERSGGDGPRLAVMQLMRAADDALAGLAPEQAVVFCARALELDATRGEAHLEPRQRVALTITLGTAQRLTGDPAYRETLLRAAAHARATGDDALLAAAALENTRGFWSVAGDVDEERIHVLEQALAVVPPEDSPTRARLLARLAGELVFSPGSGRRFALADEALDIARRLADDEVLADVLLVRVTSLLTPATIDQRLAEARELVSLGDRIADPSRRALFRAECYQLALFAGPVEGVADLLDTAEALATDLGQPTLLWLAAAGRVVQPLLAGRLEEAETLAGAAFAYGERAGQPDSLTWYGGQLTAIRYQQGRLDELVELQAAQAAALPGMPVLKSLLAVALVQGERFEEAGQVLDELSADGFAEIPMDHYWLFTLAWSAEVCRALSRRDAAAELHRLLAPWAHLPVAAGILSCGSLERYLGMAAATVGQPQVAEAHFVAAIAENERLGAPVFAALARLELADLLLDRGDPEDARRARELVEAAAPMGLGVPLVAHHAARVSSRLASHGAGRGQVRGPACLPGP